MKISVKTTYQSINNKKHDIQLKKITPTYVCTEILYKK
jgi:hypothetical protein